MNKVHTLNTLHKGMIAGLMLISMGLGMQTAYGAPVVPDLDIKSKCDPNAHDYNIKQCEPLKRTTKPQVPVVGDSYTSNCDKNARDYNPRLCEGRR